MDLLAGRAVLTSLHTFMAAELGDRFHLEEALEYGLLPVVLDSAEPKRVLDTYATLYVREEVQMEGLVRDIGPFSRFLEAVSFSHASPLNISDVARECEVGRKAVESWVEVLEDLLIAYRVPVFVKSARSLRPQDLRALKAFRTDCPESVTVLLYRGSDRLLIDGVHCLPCEEFLLNLVPEEWPGRISVRKIR